MRNLDFDLDTHMNKLELEWQQVYEASKAARDEYQALAAIPAVNTSRLDIARKRLDRAEAVKAQIWAKIQHLEENLFRST